jgi:hypothetical protein
MQDSKVIDKDITYPVMLVTNHMGDLEVTAGEKKWIFFNDNRLQ